MGLNLKSIASVHGALKLLELILVIVTFLLSRVAADENGLYLLYGPEFDHIGLGHATLVTWLIILPSNILGLVLGDQVAWRTDTLLSLAGAVLYVSVGSLTLHHNSQSQGSRYDIAMSLGAFSIITGITMFVDSIVLVFKFNKKK